MTFDGSMVLLDGTTVIVSGATNVSAADANSPSTIGALGAMLDQDQRVEARVYGTVDGAQVTAARLVLRALVGTFDVDVLSIDFDFGTMYFDDGSVALLTSSSVVTAVGDGPTDLGGVDDALAAGDRVRARGTGYLTGRVAIPDVPDSYSVIAVEFERLAP